MCIQAANKELACATCNARWYNFTVAGVSRTTCDETHTDMHSKTMCGTDITHWGTCCAPLHMEKAHAHSVHKLGRTYLRATMVVCAPAQIAMMDSV